MKTNKEMLKLLSLKNRYILMQKLNLDERERLIKSLAEAYQSILFVSKKDFYDALKKDFEDYKYYYKNHGTQYFYYKENGSIDLIHNMDDLLGSEYYRKHLKFDNYYAVEKDFPEDLKMFIYAGDTFVRGKLPILKHKEKYIMNIIFRHMLKYKDFMGKKCSIKYIHTPFYSFSHEDVVKEYEKLIKAFGES